MLAVFLFFLLLCSTPAETSKNPHQVMNLTWQVLTGRGEVAWSISENHAPSTWWPTLYPDLCKLAVGVTWNMENFNINDPAPGGKATAPFSAGGFSFGCSGAYGRHNLQYLPFYVCPGSHRPRSLTSKCGGQDQFYCASWGCETTGQTYWNPSSSWDYITVKANYTLYTRAQRPIQVFNTQLFTDTNSWGDCGSFSSGKWCTPLKISFTDKGKQATGWSGSGYSWGLRLYKQGDDMGLIFRIKLVTQALPSQSVGPNVLNEVQNREKARATPPPSSNSVQETGAVLNNNTILTQGTDDRLFRLVQGAFQALNDTAPNQTQSCWLCLTARPPFFEAIALVGNFSNYTQPPPACTSTVPARLTLPQVGRKGTCLGRGPETLCTNTYPLSPGSYYLLPPNNTWWACNTGLTPCVHSMVFNAAESYCVLVQLIPRVKFYSDADLMGKLELLHLIKREPITALTFGLMLATGLGISGVAVSSTSYLQTQGMYQLQMAMNEDIQTLEKSISLLEQSLTSLSEVVLQNRRGLDLILYKQGGLCAALGEDCCFYTDHSGVIKDSMAKLRERLKKRQKEFKSQQGWFEGWFTKSPWLTTLISTLLGPLFILLLLVILGPCVINRLLLFLRERLSVIQALVLTRDYRPLKHEEESGF